MCFTLVVNIVLCTQLNVTKSCITSATTLYKTYESYNKPCDTWIMINKAWALGISSFKWLNICSERVTRLYFIFFMSPLFIVILTLYPLYALTTSFVLNRDNNYILVLKIFLCFSTRLRLFKSHMCHLHPKLAMSFWTPPLPWKYDRKISCYFIKAVFLGFDALCSLYQYM